MKTLILLTLFAAGSFAIVASAGNRAGPVDQNQRTISEVRSLLKQGLKKIGARHRTVISENVSQLRFVNMDGVSLQLACPDGNPYSCAALRFATGDGYQCSSYLTTKFRSDYSVQILAIAIQRGLDQTTCLKNGRSVLMNHLGLLR